VSPSRFSTSVTHLTDVRNQRRADPCACQVGGTLRTGNGAGKASNMADNKRLTAVAFILASSLRAGPASPSAPGPSDLRDSGVDAL